MSITFEWGDASTKNTKIGDKVYYLTSAERGNSWYSSLGRGVTWYSLLQVVGFSGYGFNLCYPNFVGDNERIIKMAGNHLFTRKTVEKKCIKIVSQTENKSFKIIPESAHVKKAEEGNFKVIAFSIHDEEYETVAIFSGIGKLKRAKELENAIKLSKANCDILI